MFTNLWNSCFAILSAKTKHACKELGMTVLGEAGESQTYDVFLVLFRIFKRLFKTYIIA